MTKNKFTLRFTLKQHTPIIHFQADQEGATLRASELKPKLDRFVADDLKKLNPELYKKHHEMIKKFFISQKDKNQQTASSYKMKIIYDADATDAYIISSYLSKKQMDLLHSKKIKFIAPSLYFAQEKEIGALFKKEKINNRNTVSLVDDYEDKLKEILNKGIVAKDQSVRVEVFSFYESIRTLISYSLPYVLTLENFGTRQNKGFGCFSLEGQSIEDFEEGLRKLIRAKIVTAAYKHVKSYSRYNEVHGIINQDYKVLKSGINNNKDPYTKSQLFKYFCKAEQDAIRWEKRTIKQQINAIQNSAFRKRLKQMKSDPVDCGDRKGWNDLEPYNYKYIRALLGLAEQFEFQVTNSREKYIVTIKSKGKIDRFKSPLTFKVLDGHIYILAFQASISRITNELFGLTLKKKTNNGYEKINLNDIRTPEKFNIEHFLDKVVNKELPTKNDELEINYRKIIVDES